MTIQEMRDSFDWREAFKYSDGFNMDDVAEIIASENGENDGASWVAVFALSDGRYAYLEAGCDYTGWG